MTRVALLLPLLLCLGEGCAGDALGGAFDDGGLPDGAPPGPLDLAPPDGAPVEGGAADLSLPPAADPAADGPLAVAELDDSYRVGATGDRVAIHCAYPAAPSSGAGSVAPPYPVVVFGHGFQLPPSQYYGYLRRLASHGLVALTVDFPASLFGVDNVREAEDLAAGLDWVETRAEVRGIADVTRAGASGHSLGGKVALLAALRDARVQASITLDPVNSSQGCPAQQCPDVASMLGALHIPTAFIGETRDGGGGLQACAPAAANYQVFYGHAASPSVEVTALGANHMSFLDDVQGCGLVCSLCQPATAPNAQVNSMARALVAAFYLRYLRGDVRYDAYLSGAAVQARYVATGEVQIETK